jgi:four helix bundle protein
MENKAFAERLEKRTKGFTISIIRLSAKLPNTPEGRVVRNQITKFGTSVGANYREANRARSRADFISKIKISEGEASETRFWLEIIKALSWLDTSEIEPLYGESSELLAIFTSIGSKN